MKQLILATAFTTIFLSNNCIAQPTIKIEGDNNKVIDEYNKKLNSVKQYLATVKAEVKKSDIVLKVYKAKGLSPRVPAQGSRFGELSVEGNTKFGDAWFIEPFGQCGVLGGTAASLWQAKIGNNDLTAMRKLYTDTLDGCNNQIKNKPEPTLTISTTPAVDKPPFKNCLEIVDVSENKKNVSTWTCPKNSIKK